VKKLTLILLTIVVATSGASAVAKPETQRLAAASAATAPVTKAESTRLLNGLAPGDEIAPRLKKIKASIQALQSPLATKRLQMASLNRGHAETIALDRTLAKLRTGFDAVERRIGPTGGRASVDANRAAIDALRTSFDSAIKDLESKEKMGNFDIQGLMSMYNRAQTAASDVAKKVDDAKTGITQNLQ
jgi:prefoldin subunit 5